MNYAKVASRIRTQITQRAAEIVDSDDNHESSDDEDQLRSRQEQGDHEYPLHLIDPNINANPAHPRRRTRSLRSLSSATRLEIVSKAASLKYCSEDLAIMYGVKVHAVNALKHDAMRKPKRFLKKKAAELRKAKHEAAIKTVVRAFIDKGMTIWTLK